MLGSFHEYFIGNEIADDREATAAAICKALKLSDHQQCILMPLIEDGVRDLMRRRTQSVEGGDRAGRRVVDPTGQRAAYLAERFAIGDGRMVTWGEATVDDHQARIAFLELMRTGIDATIDRHRAAVAQIIEHGVKCLGEIDDTDAAVAA